MTPAILIQTQQVMSVLRRAKPVQEQHLAEVFDCLLDQLSLVVGCIPATHKQVDIRRRCALPAEGMLLG